MFPRRMAALEGDLPWAGSASAIRSPICRASAAYLKSDRRLAFNTDGIFRHYPELDAA